VCRNCLEEGQPPEFPEPSGVPRLLSHAGRRAKARKDGGTMARILNSAPMNEFKIKRGRHDLAGREVWLVIDLKATSEGDETIAGVIIPSNSGKALLRAMRDSGVKEDR